MKKLLTVLSLTALSGCSYFTFDKLETDSQKIEERVPAASLEGPDFSDLRPIGWTPLNTWLLYGEKGERIVVRYMSHSHTSEKMMARVDIYSTGTPSEVLLDQTREPQESYQCTGIRSRSGYFVPRECKAKVRGEGMSKDDLFRILRDHSLFE